MYQIYLFEKKIYAANNKTTKTATQKRLQNSKNNIISDLIVDRDPDEVVNILSYLSLFFFS
jgi:hypothetical protein